MSSMSFVLTHLTNVALVNIPKVKLLFLKHDLIKKGEVVGGFCCKNEMKLEKNRLGWLMELKEEINIQCKCNYQDF